MRIVVASQNPVKLEATRRGFAELFPGEALDITPVSVPSGAGDQPMSDAETLRGAATRAANARQARPEAGYWVGIEGGVAPHDGDLLTFAWVVIRSGKRTGRARTASFFLPDEVAGLVRAGMELGDADDRFFGRQNSKQDNGAIGILTNDAIDRAGLYVPAVVMALIPFINPALRFGS